MKFTSSPGNSLPKHAGLSLKPEYFQDVQAQAIEDLWFEVHPENYMIDGGPRLEGLLSISQNYPLSLHGVGASLGGPELPDADHLQSLKRLVDLLDPASVSEHAVWSWFDGKYFADLMPLPRTRVAKQQLIDGIDCFQNAIGRKILIENPSNYLPVIAEMDEAEFLVDVAQTSGCGLLVDVNNLYLSEKNCGINTQTYLQAIPPDLVGEIHVAGFSLDQNLGKKLLIDSHADDVDDAVWDLLDKALALFGAKPVLLERDGNLPSFARLLEERQLAKNALGKIQNWGIAANAVAQN